MNIAFPVLLITLALLPGFLLRLSYLRGTFRRSPVTAQMVGGDIVWAAFLSLALHAAAYQVFPASWLPDAGVLLALFTGQFGKDAVYFGLSVASFTYEAERYLGYITLLSALAAAAGLALHRVVRRNKLDHRYPFLRFPNDWHYLLEPEDNTAIVDLLADPDDDVPDERDMQYPVRVEPTVYITAVVDLKLKSPQLFRGLVHSWALTATGELESVVLREAYRRDLEPGPDVPRTGTLADYYRIEGHRFVLRRSEMITLNIIYVYQVDNDLLEEALEELGLGDLDDQEEPDDLGEDDPGEDDPGEDDPGEEGEDVDADDERKPPAAADDLPPEDPTRHPA